MAAEAKANGKTLLDEMQEIYKEYGYFLDALDSFTLKGKDGLEKIASMMSTLRSSGSPFADTECSLSRYSGSHCDNKNKRW